MSQHSNSTASLILSQIQEIELVYNLSGQFSSTQKNKMITELVKLLKTLA